MQEAGRPMHRTAFTRGAADGGLLFNPFDMALKNVSNTGVLMWAGRLLSLYEVRWRRQ
jgi:carotenoid cleavage dioxygenase-like enzyme